MLGRQRVGAAGPLPGLVMLAWFMQTVPATPMKTPTFDLKHPMETFAAAREQMRLSLHLLNLDARQKWDEFEAKILNLESKIGQEAESLSDATANAAIDLSGSVRDFVDNHVRSIKH